MILQTHKHYKTLGGAIVFLLEENKEIFQGTVFHAGIMSWDKTGKPLFNPDSNRKIVAEASQEEVEAARKGPLGGCEQC